METPRAAVTIDHPETSVPRQSRGSDAVVF